MNVKGDHNFKVTKQQLWNYLMDPEVLAAITPGISKLERLGEDEYKSVSEIKIGPVKGSFSGKLKVEEKEEPNSFAIVMEQLSKIGNAHVKVAMNLDDGEIGSKLSFDGKAKLSGVIARTGQRVLSGVANTITKDVFASLESYIDEDTKSTEASEAEKVEESVTSQSPEAKVQTVNKNGENITGESNSTEESGNLFSGFINFFKSIFSS